MNNDVIKRIISSLKIGATIFVICSIAYFFVTENWFFYASMCTLACTIGYFVTKSINALNKSKKFIIITTIIIIFIVLLVEILMIQWLEITLWFKIFTVTFFPFLYAVFFSNIN